VRLFENPLSIDCEKKNLWFGVLGKRPPPNEARYIKDQILFLKGGASVAPVKRGGGWKPRKGEGALVTKKFPERKAA